MNDLERLIWLKNWYLDRKAELQSQPSIIKAIKGDAKVERAITDLYFRLFNRPLRGCGSCLADALTELLYYSKRNMESIIECRFKLKAGVLLADSRNILPMATSGNLTDEIAIAYIADNPARKNLFSVLPSDIDDLVASYNERRKTPSKRRKTTNKTK